MIPFVLLVACTGGRSTPEPADPEAPRPPRAAPVGDLFLDERLDGYAGQEDEDGPPSLLGGHELVAGDVDGNGLPEVITGEGFDLSVLHVRLDGITREIVDAEDSPASLALADVDGDDDLEIIAGTDMPPPPTRDALGAEVVHVYDGDALAARLRHAESHGYGTYKARALGDELVVSLARDGEGRGRVWLLDSVSPDADLDAAASARWFGAEALGSLGVEAPIDADDDGLLEPVVTTIALEDRIWILPDLGPGDHDLEADALLLFEDGRPGAPGDIDGDGIQDLVVVDSGRALVFLGPFSRTLTAEDAVAVVRSGSEPIETATIARDLDGDGFDELIVGAPEDDVVGVLYGPIEGDHTLADAGARLHGGVPGARVGSELLGPGDLDGDGYGDLVIGAEFYDFGRGALYVVRGGVR